MVTAVALLIIVYVITNVMADFVLFTRDTCFPGQQAFIIGTLLSLLITTYVTYRSRLCYQSNAVLGSYIMFLVAYTLFSINLALTSEYHVKGAVAKTNAGFYMAAALVFLLVLLYYTSLTIVGEAMLLVVPIAWTMYMLHKWWYRRVLFL